MNFLADYPQDLIKTQEKIKNEIIQIQDITKKTNESLLEFKEWKENNPLISRIFKHFYRMDFEEKEIDEIIDFISHLISKRGNKNKSDSKRVQSKCDGDER